MSLFGSLMGDVEDDPFFGSHMRHMRQMNNMMNSLFSDPFGMLGGGGPLAIGGPRHGGPMMPFMPQMPSINRLFSDLDGGHMGPGHMGVGHMGTGHMGTGHMGTGHMGPGHMGPGHMGAATSFSSSTVVMSSGPNGKPQVYRSSSSTKIGPNGVKETRKTLQDSRTGTKKMSIGHHIGERAHVVEREQNVYSGDAEERQEFINLDEDEAEDFDREFHQKAMVPMGGRGRAILPPRRSPPQLALPAPPLPLPTELAPPLASPQAPNASEERRHSRPTARRPLRTNASPLSTHSSSVREVYGSAHPQRRHRHARHSRNSDN